VIAAFKSPDGDCPLKARSYKDRRDDAAVALASAVHGHNAEAILPVLHAAQTANGGFLDSARMGAAADALKLPDARVFGIASFYSLLSTRPRSSHVLRLCDGPVCTLRDAPGARASLETAGKQGWVVERCSCLGLCDRAPAGLVGLEPCGPLSPKDAGAVLAGQCGAMPIYGKPRLGETRVMMARIGRIDPGCIDRAIEAGAYQVLGDALTGERTRILDALDRSGLRGCGGAGFLTGRKWRMVAEADGPHKVVVCDADESEPGAFKDRVLMDGDPHLLLEGLALAAYATGADTGIIYIRGEYEWIAQKLERAIAQAEDRGWLGTGIHGSRFSLRVQVHRGAGAYVCGEETALLESLEGKRGEPHSRPPYPTSHGLHGLPTLVNNVETLCQVPAIVRRGANGPYPLTKLFTVTGSVNQPGMFEALLGITLRQVVELFGGGVRGGARFKAALVGGAAGMFVPAGLLDVPIDFTSAGKGVPLGSGAIIVMDESVSIPSVVSCLLHFFAAGVVR
jgi:NADH:ubiquinone oxidoreductase subunit F (NADH-binding)/NADH:ubiquinone oxidoreductase subunit E